MKGYIDEFRQARLELKVIGEASTVDIPFVLDTGFDGALCLPVGIAVPLGLRLKGVQDIEYADGVVKRELVFLGRVIIDGQEVEVDIFLTDSKDALMGTQLLANRVAILDFRHQTVEIR